MPWYPPQSAHLFINNAPPRAAEVSTITQLLVGLTATFEESQRRTRDLQQRLYECQGILSRIRALPFEILGRIFAFTLAHSEPHQGTRIKATLVDLCLVCKSWRDAALATPRLWCKVTINASNFSVDDFESADRWLRRSGVVRKTLKILGPPDLDKGGFCPHGDCKAANAGLVKLLTEGPTLDALECTLYQCTWNLFDTMESSKSDRPRPWDSLRSLRSVAWFDWEKPFQRGNTIFRNLPVVKSFTLCMPELSEDWDLEAYFPAFKTLSIPLPFLANLTTVNLALRCVVGWTMYYAVLGHCINVETASIDFHGWEQIEPGHIDYPHHPGVELKNLRSLRLSHLPVKSTRYLSAIEAPFLEELDISFDDGKTLLPHFSTLRQESCFGYSVNLAEHFLVAVPPEGPLCLTRLRIHHLRTYDEILEEILLRSPALTHLTLDTVEFDFEFFLGKEEYNPDVLRHLETLELLNLFGHFKDHGKCLHRTISSRAAASRLPNEHPWLKKFVTSNIDGHVQQTVYPDYGDVGAGHADQRMQSPGFDAESVKAAWYKSNVCHCRVRAAWQESHCDFWLEDGW